MLQRPSYPCPRCQIGHCHPDVLTYVRMYHGMLLSVPEMPAWTCDICGLQEFDREVVLRIEKLITAERVKTGRKPAKTQRPKP